MRTIATERFLRIHAGLERVWYVTDRTYAGWGGGLSLLSFKGVDAPPRTDEGWGGHLGLQASAVAGMKVGPHTTVELRPSVSPYRHITVPALELAVAFRK